jgi:hypothetical protein
MMSRRDLSRLLALPALLAAGLWVGSLTARADMPVTQFVPPPPDVLNTCATPVDDVVTTGGVMKITFHITQTPSGNLHLDSMDSTTNWTGVGVPSLVNYSESQTDHSILNLNPTQVTTTRMDLRMIPQSKSVPPFTISVFLHIVFPQGGPPTANIERIDRSC